jgi:hypothetical protein
MITAKRLTPPPRFPRWGPWRKPQIFAVFSYRFDAHLVPDLLANIEPIVDGWVAYDDRGASGIFSSEMARRRALLAEARRMGAEWILAVDPDERFEVGLKDKITALVRKRRRVAWGVRLREMYSPTEYRIDGIWGRKIQYRLFSVYDPAELVGDELHDQWFPRNGRFELKHCDVNLYHLKMIDPKRRLARRDLYNRLDPDRKYQPIGYDYLTNEAGACFETIPLGRAYHPPHRDDGGLWMHAPAPADVPA